MALSRDDIKDQVQQATDIVRLIGEHVALRPKGRERVGLCPFHDDKSPSLNVSPTKQIYKCFACGAGGDCFSFVMNYHKMSFPEALRHLAERAGIEVPTYQSSQEGASSDPSGGTSQRKLIGDASALALEFFRVMLKHAEHGQTARQYLENRGISGQMQAQFQIGCAPDRWDGLVQMIQSKNWDRRGFELAGLISHRPNGEGLYDRFRHRLIFPICDALGRPIAFGGRKLREEDEPKYLNSPEQALFNKSATLYGLNHAKKAIIDARVAVVVEGYTDVIACHQRGIHNVVATLGTALTAQHVNVLRRFADKVVLIFDADAAGDKAADRAVELFLTGDLDVAITRLPEGLDPFDLMGQDDGVDVWQQALASAQDALDFQLERVRQRLEAADTVTGQQRVIEDYLARISQLGLNRISDIRRPFVVQRLGKLLKTSEEQVSQILKRHQRLNSPRQVSDEPGTAESTESALASENWGQNVVAPAVSGSKLKSLEKAERQIIGALVRQPTLFDQSLADGRPFDETVTEAVFVSRPGRQLFQVVSRHLAEERDVSVHRLSRDLAEMDRQDLCDLLTGAEAEVEQITAGQPDKLASHWQLACTALLDHHDEMNLRRQRPTTFDSDQDLRRYVEQRGRRLSPGRIPRTAPEGT